MFPSAAEILGDAHDRAPSLCDEKSSEDWTTLRSVRDEVLKALEEARNNKLIGTGLEAQVTVTAADPVYSVLARHADQLRYLFIVSAVTLTQASGNGTGRRTRRGEESRRSQVRTLLELFDPRRRGQDVSHGLRTVQRGAERDSEADPVRSSDPVNWRKLRTFLLTVLALCLIPATRYYQIDVPLLRFLRGSRHVDPLSLHLAGEFVENNLGTEQDPDGSVTVRMIAQQYLFVPHCILVPAGVPVHLRITSADAVHSLTFNGTDYASRFCRARSARLNCSFPSPAIYKTVVPRVLRSGTLRHAV